MSTRPQRNPLPKDALFCSGCSVKYPKLEITALQRLILSIGGGLRFGSAGQPAYDGSAFAAYQDVVLVAANYRTNVFGFPNSQELPITSQNLAFLDQRVALQWIQDNIDKFGGDPTKVTIMGESSGALSVDALITSFDTETAPFRAGILESGQASYGSADSILGTATDPFAELAYLLNCPAGQSNLTCVRAADATAIRKTLNENNLNFLPVVDNVTSFGPGALRRQAGKFARVPILGGSNFQEGRLFQYGQTTNFSAFLQQTFGTTAPQQIPLVEAAYGPVGTTPGLNTDFDLVSAVFTDLNFQCSEALQANQTAASGVPAWRYIYNATFPNTEVFPGSGAFHSSEVVEVFQTYAGGPVNPTTHAPQGLERTNLPPTAQQYALSSYMNGVWANFAKNPVRGPGWPSIGGQFNETLGVLGVDSSSGVTVVDPSVVNYRCPLFYPLYEAALGGVTLPGLGS